MATILIVESSANKDSSFSRLLTAEFVSHLKASGNQHQFVYRDLVDQPIPVLNNDIVGIIRTPPDKLTEQQRQATVLSETLIRELKEADFVVIGSAMYNWSISASLKAWLDQVMRIGFTFGHGANGVEGLLGNKPALAILSRGGSYDTPERAAVDMQKPYLTNVLKVLGLDTTFAVMEGSLMGDEVRDANLAKARQVIVDVAAAIQA
jgi:FMN-dependent NADH-azoreductase